MPLGSGTPCTMSSLDSDTPGTGGNENDTNTEVVAPFWLPPPDPDRVEPAGGFATTQLMADPKLRSSFQKS